MWSILVSIAMWLIRLVSNPYVSLAAQGVIAILKQVPDGFCQDAIALVKVATADPKLADGKSMFKYVFNELRARYPNLGENTIKAAIEVFVGAQKKELI